MDYFITNSVLIQIEFSLDERARNVYRVVTFFRCTHVVDISEPIFQYKKAKESFSNRCKMFL